MQRAGQILVPFIPPFLRVNRKTWDQIPSRQTIQQAAQSCWACCSWTRLSIFGTWSFLYLVAISIEQGLIFVILSGFLLILTNLEDIQDKDHPNYLSAYSVFNHGRRMLGSLNAEQFENEIRHRRPDQHQFQENHHELPQDLPHDDVHDDEERDMRLAIQLSLEEAKRKGLSEHH